MTTTDIGILLIVLCIVLWAIMAALHRHTVQMEALKAQVQELLKAQRANAAAEVARTPQPRDNADGRTAYVPASPPTFKTRHTLSK
ncbi:MAG TPA: hypothetical protein VJ833_04235 [Rhodanobacteraceae bacterium]|nr:hypothetical protein [Rhodanobacteraceae bacterium]